MRLIISTIVVGIVLFLLGWLFFGILFVDFFKTYSSGMGMRGESDLKIWAFAVGSLTRALFLYWIFSIGYKGGFPMFEGIKFGILISLFFAIPNVFYIWGSTPIKYQGAIADGAIQMVILTIGGILTRIIHGRGSQPAKTA